MNASTTPDEIAAIRREDRAASRSEQAIVVSVAQDGDAARWQAWVDAQPAATIYHAWGWRRVLSKAFGHRPYFLIAQRGDRVCGVLPLAEVKTLLFGHSLSSLPFCPYAGPLAKDREALDALDRHADALGGRLGVDHLEYRSLGDIHGDGLGDKLDDKLGNSHRNWPSQDLYVVFRKAIGADHDANMSAIPRKQRAMVRKGIKAGLSSEPGDVATFFELFADNVHRHGTPAHHRRFFELTLEAFPGQSDILIVRDPQGRPLSGVLNLYHRDEVLPMHAGDHAAAREFAANDFKYWELMRRSADRGYRVFNYGRSKRGTGPFDFKKNWGFEPTPLRYEYRLYKGGGVPQNNPLNPKYRMMIATWRRLPRGVVNAIGPYIVRGLG